MEHDNLIAEWEEDSKIDRTKLMDSLYRCPVLHSKYLGKLQHYKVLLRKKFIKYEKLKAIKTKYYNGEMSKDELDEHGWSQYLFKKPMKSEMETILNGDSDLSELKEQMEYVNILIQTCESIMKDIHSRNFLLKNIVDLMKFEAGA